MQGQGQGQQQAYDRGTTIFSPDGRLYQVEYAREAVKQGTGCIGVRTAEGVILLVDNEKPSLLLERSSIEKLHKVDDSIGIASAGHVADGHQLIDFARQQAQINRLRYDEPIGVESLTKQITDHIQEYTQVGGARPFGVGLLIGGIENGAPRLYEVGPGGTPREWAAVAIGKEGSEIQTFLKDEYAEPITLDDGIELALSALASVKESNLGPETVGIATIDKEGGRYQDLSDDRVRAYLERAGSLGEPSGDSSPG